MHRFGDQIELRVDRRHVLLFFLGAVFWTFVAFFFGMLVAGNGKTRHAERGLAALGWLDRHAQKQLEANRRTVAFAFARHAPARAVQPAARAGAPPTAPAPRHAAGVTAKPADGQSDAQPAPVAPRAAPRRQRPARQAVRPAVPAAIPTAPRPAVVKRGQWTYRIAMRIPQKARAFRFLRQLSQRGYAPIIATLRRGARGRTYRITFGRFATRERADAVAKQLRRKRIPGRLRVIRVR